MQRMRRGAYGVEGLWLNIGVTADQRQHPPTAVVKHIPGRGRRLLRSPSLPGDKVEKPQPKQRQSRPANRGAMIANPAIGFAQKPLN